MKFSYSKKEKQQIQSMITNVLYSYRQMEVIIQLILFICNNGRAKQKLLNTSTYDFPMYMNECETFYAQIESEGRKAAI